MRLFVGIDLPEEVKAALHRLTLQLERSSSAGSFVPLENFHLTLAFIGESSQTAEIKDALEQAASEYRAHYTDAYEPSSLERAREEGASIAAVPEPITSLSKTGFELAVSGIGSFKQRKGHTWWVGIGQGQDLERLQSLQRMIVTALRASGFDLEKRSYKPHITLARSVQTKGLVSLEPPELIIPVEEFCLFSSRAVSGKQEYTILESFSL